MRMIPNIRDKSFYYFWQLMRLDLYEHKLIVLDGKNLPIKIKEEDLEKNQFGTTYYADYFDKYFQETAISLSYTRSPYHFPCDNSGFNPIFLNMKKRFYLLGLNYFSFYLNAEIDYEILK